MRCGLYKHKRDGHKQGKEHGKVPSWMRHSQPSQGRQWDTDIRCITWRMPASETVQVSTAAFVFSCDKSAAIWVLCGCRQVPRSRALVFHCILHRATPCIRAQYMIFMMINKYNSSNKINRQVFLLLFLAIIGIARLDLT